MKVDNDASDEVDDGSCDSECMRYEKRQSVVAR